MAWDVLSDFPNTWNADETWLLYWNGADCYQNWIGNLAHELNTKPRFEQRREIPDLSVLNSVYVSHPVFPKSLAQLQSGTESSRTWRLLISALISVFWLASCIWSLMWYCSLFLRSPRWLIWPYWLSVVRRRAERSDQDKIERNKIGVYLSSYRRTSIRTLCPILS